MLTGRPQVEKYSAKADVFSFGVLIVEMYTGEVPYSREHTSLPSANLMYKIANEGLRPSTEGLPVSLSQLVTDCWNDDPQLRPSFSEIISRLRRMSDLVIPNERPRKKRNRVGSDLSVSDTDSTTYSTLSSRLLMTARITDNMEISDTDFSVGLSDSEDSARAQEFTAFSATFSDGAMPFSSSINSVYEDVEREAPGAEFL